MPIIVGVLVLATRPAPPARVGVLLSAAGVLALVAPVLPLSLILLSVAAVAGRRARRQAPGQLRRLDVAFLRLAHVGVGASVAAIVTTVLVYLV
jgi:hypothetical protein